MDAKKLKTLKTCKILEKHLWKKLWPGKGPPVWLTQRHSNKKILYKTENDILKFIVVFKGWLPVLG